MTKVSDLVKVERLKWRWDRTAYSAKTKFGEYRVADIHGEWMWFFNLAEDKNDKGTPLKNTERSAKASAQADYEARVYAALMPADKPSVAEAAQVLLDNPLPLWDAFGNAGINNVVKLDAALRALAAQTGEAED